MMPVFARWSACAAILAISHCARSAEFSWRESGAGLAVTIITNPGPVIFSVVRVELDHLNKEIRLTTTLASNTVVGTDNLSNHLSALPREFGTPIAAING